jgi:hypothetical protein
MVGFGEGWQFLYCEKTINKYLFGQSSRAFRFKSTLRRGYRDATMIEDGGVDSVVMVPDS